MSDHILDSAWTHLRAHTRVFAVYKTIEYLTCVRNSPDLLDMCAKNPRIQMRKKMVKRQIISFTQNIPNTTVDRRSDQSAQTFDSQYHSWLDHRKSSHSQKPNDSAPTKKWRAPMPGEYTRRMSEPVEGSRWCRDGKQ